LGKWTQVAAAKKIKIKKFFFLWLRLRVKILATWVTNFIFGKVDSGCRRKKIKIKKIFYCDSGCETKNGLRLRKQKVDSGCQWNLQKKKKINFGDSGCQNKKSKKKNWQIFFYDFGNLSHRTKLATRHRATWVRATWRNPLKITRGSSSLSTTVYLTNHANDNPDVFWPWVEQYVKIYLIEHQRTPVKDQMNHNYVWLTPDYESSANQKPTSERNPSHALITFWCAFFNYFQFYGTCGKADMRAPLYRILSFSNIIFTETLWHGFFT